MSLTRWSTGCSEDPPGRRSRIDGRMSGARPMRHTSTGVRTSTGSDGGITEPVFLKTTMLSCCPSSATSWHVAGTPPAPGLMLTCATTPAGGASPGPVVVLDDGLLRVGEPEWVDSWGEDRSPDGPWDRGPPDVGDSEDGGPPPGGLSERVGWPPHEVAANATPRSTDSIPCSFMVYTCRIRTGVRRLPRGAPE